MVRRKKTQAEFITEARAKHGDRYDYSKVVYEGTDLKIAIGCSIHGEFQQTPSTHIRGSGCPRCAVEGQTPTTAEFIEKARAKHGDRYDYSRICYVNQVIKITLICPKHEEFEIIPNNHLQGRGCRKCSIERQSKHITSTKEEFVRKAQAKHEDKYDYSQVKYVNSKTKVTIICLKHGLFEQTPGSHLKSGGCLKCGREARIEGLFSFEYKDVRYCSLKHACQELGKNYKVVLQRLKSGWTIEQVLKDELRDPSYAFKANGVTYKSILDAVQQLNAPVCDTTVRERLTKGMSPEEALFTPPKFGHSNGAIYAITNLINGKQYVGLTVTSLQERWERHLKQAFGKNASLIHKAIVEFGKENFTIDVIDSASSIEELGIKERQWIQKLNTLTPNGYNVTQGGELGGFPGKPTRLPGDPTFYPSIKAAAQALALKEGISQCAAEHWISVGRIDVEKTHGMARTPVHEYWNYLVCQAVNPKSKNYNGSTICDRWRDFVNFYEDVGKEYEKGKSLQRVDSSKPYSKDNCRWIWRRGEERFHSLFETPIYKSWRSIVRQYCNPKSKGYDGSEVCDRWRDFALFCEDMASTHQEGFKLIRLDRDKPYSPENCEWKNRREAAQTHGMTRTRFYNFWARLKHNRTNPTARDYEGTTLCDRWQKFENFKADMYDSYQEGMRLKLLDPSQPYSKDNCRWVAGNKVAECCDRQFFT